MPVIRPLAPQLKEPTLTQYDAWGNRVDLLQVSEGWKTLKAFACREGVISIAYERKFGEKSRVYQFAKTMLLIGDCHVVRATFSLTCPRTRRMLTAREDR
jgi:hypothetical protein